MPRPSSLRSSSLLLLSPLLLLACSDAGGAGDDDDVRPDAGSPADAPDPVPARCITPFRDRQWGGDRDDRAAVTISRSGGVFVYGYDNGEVAENNDPGATARSFLGRWDGDRETWGWSLPGAGGTIDVVTVDAFDRLEAVGRTYSGKQSQLAFATLTPFGVQWSVSTFGRAPSERPFALLADGDARAIVGFDDIYIPGSAVQAWEEPFVYRWDARDGADRGGFVMLGTDRPDVVTGGAFMADGRVAVTGSVPGSSAGSFVIPVGAAFGTPTWRQPGGIDDVHAIQPLAGGDFIIAGSTGHRLGDRAYGEQDAFVARLGPDLTTVRWITQLGSAAPDFTTALTVDADGRSWIVGETLGAFAGIPAGNGDLFVAALDVDGTLRWEQQVGSEGDDRPSSIAVDACENVVVAGMTSGHLVDSHQPRRYDAFVINIAHE